MQTPEQLNAPIFTLPQWEKLSNELGAFLFIVEDDPNNDLDTWTAYGNWDINFYYDTTDTDYIFSVIAYPIINAGTDTTKWYSILKVVIPQK